MSKAGRQEAEQCCGHHGKGITGKIRDWAKGAICRVNEMIRGRHAHAVRR
jgi:hypothetical protein